VPDALEHLKSLIDVFQEGTTRPVPFFPKTSYAFAENYISGRGIIEAAKVWDGDRWPEKSDDAISILFRDADPLKPPLFDEFKDLAIRVYGPVLERARV
jgi:exodeoxyribonuclease V gamma subunit